MVGAPVAAPVMKAKLSASGKALPHEVGFALAREPSKVEHGAVHSVLHRIEQVVLNWLRLVSETTHVWL